MGLKAIPNVYSYRCDECNTGSDPVQEYESIKECLEDLKSAGWKGNYKKLLCPECANKSK
jgi:hypothetical protein